MFVSAKKEAAASAGNKKKGEQKGQTKSTSPVRKQKKRAVASAGNNKNGGQKGQTKSTSPVARKTTVDTETGSPAQKSTKKVTGGDTQKEIFSTTGVTEN